MEQLLVQQTLYLRAVKRAVINFNKIGKNKQTASAIRNRIKLLNEDWAHCQLLQAQIETHESLPKDEAEKNALPYFANYEYEDAEQSFYENSDALNALLDEIQGTVPAPAAGAGVAAPPAVVPVNPVQIKLPQIELPKFSGSYLEWENFRDMFISLVVNNQSLSDVQRLHYLKTSLSDEAGLVLKNVPVRAANYQTAWETLEKRYGNPRATIDAYLKTFFALPVVGQDSLRDLKTLRDTVNDVITALTNLKRPVKHWGDLIVFFVVQRLDKQSRREWETQLGDSTEYPTYAALEAFLAVKIRTLEAINSPTNTNSRGNSGSQTKSNNSRTDVKSHVASETTKCPACQENHLLFQCAAFKSKAVRDRQALVREHRCCFNCLRPGHIPKNCSSKNVCSKCQRKHHTLIHGESNSSVNSNATSQNTDASATRQNSSIPHAAVNTNSDVPASISRDPPLNVSSHVGSRLPDLGHAVVLATAQVIVKTASGRALQVRALLDQGSESTFVTESVAQALRAPRQRTSIPVTGLGGNPAGHVRNAAILTIEPIVGNGRGITVRALILTKLTANPLPRVSGCDRWQHLRGLQLADSDPNASDQIDLLIGADCYGFVLLDGMRQGGPGAPFAQRTIFGWVLSGSTSNPQTTTTSLHVQHCNTTCDLDQTLRQFWETEELPRKTYLTDDDVKCEEHFVNTHQRASDGRYIVRLPFKTKPPLALGDSRAIATASFNRLERRFERKPDQAVAYREFLEEYERLGHMRLVNSESDANVQEVYYPHHPVVRDTSSTTKLRVVFNASCPTSNGQSLNDYLLTGRKLQTELPSIILRWRTHKYVYTADMAKMFRQIWINPLDLDYQRILWRSDKSQPISAYQLLTVTYGTASAPFLAMRVIQQVNRDEGKNYPLAVPILQRNIYVDDVLFGADDLVLARQTREQVTRLLKSGGFHLRKWASNCPELLKNDKSGDHELATDRLFEEGEGLKVLGIFWTPLNDVFRFKINVPNLPTPTKRSVLSIISKLFDPLGWVCPVVVTAKILMQRLWISKGDWDDELPIELLTIWQQYCAQLPLLEQLNIPRWTVQGNDTLDCEIHGFADASNLAYGAVVYLRIRTISDSVHVTLLTAKSKVAPIKPLSIPRLELSAAVLLARVVESVQNTMSLETVPVYCWTDSTVALAWIQKHPSTLMTFAANRVAAIHNHAPKAIWKHVPTKENPADCASRGLYGSEILSHTLWWNGPEWLRATPDAWPNTKVTSDPAERTEEKKPDSRVLLVLPAPKWELIDNVSSWDRLLRITAYVFRFVNNTRRTPAKASETFTEEIDKARRFWIKTAQSQHFEREILDLRAKQAVSPNSKLRRLDPYLDDFGIIRVGGRLRNATLTLEQKSPIILPKHRVVELLIAHTHARVLHGGSQLTLRTLRHNFWIIGARNLVRSYIHQCVICVRERARIPQQLMGDLPRERVNRSPPFTHSGVDYAGPILVRTAPGRGHKSHKAYISVFVCLATRAIHLEIVSDYSSDAFLAAFARFTSRRGIPVAVYSDNGTTFQGAEKELTRAFQAVCRDRDLLSRLASDGTHWQFIPPAAPHFGGLWEAGVKSVKHHLRRVLGSHTPTFEELNTLLCKIEACLNSRPIAPLTDELESFDALTPGHFLIGAPLKAIPAPSLLDLNDNRLSRWQLMQKMLEQFWKLWSTDYLHTLQQRFKWSERKPDLEIGDLVLLRNPNLPPAKWDLGRILECHPGDDNLTRVVTVKTARTVLKRPITQVCPLPVRVPPDPAAME